MLGGMFLIIEIEYGGVASSNIRGIRQASVFAPDKSLTICLPGTPPSPAGAVGASDSANEEWP